MTTNRSKTRPASDFGYKPEAQAKALPAIPSLARQACVLVLFWGVAAFADDPKPAITLEVASWDEAQAIVKKQQEKIVVLDLWSTGCQPCVKEFPQLVKLQTAYPKEVVCISLNCNYYGSGKPEDEREDVLKFLKKQNAAILNLLSSEADEDLYKKVGIASIPVVRVYDRSGKLAKQFDNEKDEYGKDGFTYEKHINPYVKKLVESK
jgi:thiol-disulfide isomerase/thioredoxin